ncbi:hypothetical protein BO226_11230 [Rhodococcus sp. 2G]|uniref:hypothetical protein n=1 Tax=Rhodococcus sp. 2G TaxID=1570939 RepID=UPI00090411B6|nr:hypothetical protein [Rhodococcus sp. 2G]APE09705.1 hypothetical protein BO226_11230 [Rhodococcus sp. 2G]
MVVSTPLPFANAEKLVILALEDLGWTDIDPPPEDVEIGIRVNRVGGTDDGITDYPRFEISCFAPSYDEVNDLSETVRDRMLALGGEVFVLDGRRVTIDFCRTDVPPESTPYENPDRIRKTAWYQAGLMRPRPA